MPANRRVHYWTVDGQFRTKENGIGDLCTVSRELDHSCAGHKCVAHLFGTHRCRHFRWIYYGIVDLRCRNCSSAIPSNATQFQQCFCFIWNFIDKRLRPILRLANNCHRQWCSNRAFISDNSVYTRVVSLAASFQIRTLARSRKGYHPHLHI